VAVDLAMITAIIPARNEEAAIARAVESVAAQPEIAEVIVVNDQSTDGTARILAELSMRLPKVRVITTDELPAGWVGKNHAVALGAAEARTDWLLFTDADTFHLMGSARRALADAAEHNAVLVSYSPEQEMDSWWERAMIPFVYCRLAAHFSFAQVNRPDTKDAAANGQYLMVLREVYEAVGGHASAAIRGEILEDVALARAVKGAGYGIYFTAPMGTVRTRMYRSFGAMWQGWTKNLYPLMGGTGAATLRELVEVAPWFEALLIGWCVWHGARTGRLDWELVAGVAVLALLYRLVRYGFDLYKNLYPIVFIQYWLPGVSLYSAALVASWWKNTRGRVTWKGRSYAAGGSRRA
jgi:glycosyltransferase involved in cell wall biosynthesis